MDWATFFGAILGSAITASISVYLANKAIKNDIANLDKVIKTRIGVEVLSKNRQEWINQVRDCVITLEVNLNYIQQVFTEKCMTISDKEKLTHELSDIYMKTISTLIKLQLLLSSKKNTEKKMDESNNDYHIRKRSNLCMLILNKKLEKLKDIMWDYQIRAQGVIYNREMHPLFPPSIKKITHSSFGILFITKKLIQIEWKRISKIQ